MKEHHTNKKPAKETVPQKANRDRLQAFCAGVLVMCLVAVIVVVVASLHYMVRGSIHTMPVQRLLRNVEVAGSPIMITPTYEKGCLHLKVINLLGEKVDLTRLDIQEMDKTGILSVSSWDIDTALPDDACLKLGTIKFKEESSTCIKAYCQGFEAPAVTYIDWRVEFTPRGELAATKTEDP